MDNKKNIFDNYANYLTDCIADIKFLDKDNLREYLKTHLNLFYSECLDDHLLPDLDKRKNYLIEENKRLALARVGMEEQILSSKSALRERRYVDTAWLARLNYAFRMKGVQIQNNVIELGKLSDIKRSIVKAANIEKANTEDRAKLACFRMEFTNRFGIEALREFVTSAENKLHKHFEKTKI